MNRKKFIQATAGLGIGLTLLPSLNKGNQMFNGDDNETILQPKITREGEGEVLNVLGDVQTHKLIGSETGNRIVEWVDDVEPGVGIPTHVHTREDEVFRVLKGQVEITVDGTITLLKPGDTAFAPRNVPHAWLVVGTEKAKMISTAFPAGIERMFRELSELPPGPPDFQNVADICEKYGISFL